MSKFVVITDSTSDLPLEYRERYNVEYVKMSFNIDGREFVADLDWNEITPKEYYDLMRKGCRSITGLVKTAEFEQKFEEALARGMDVLYLACSSKLSGSLNGGKIVAEELLEKYPDRKIVCFDTLRSNLAEGLIAIKASQMAQEGKSLEEVIKTLEEDKLKYQTYATVGTLDYLRKAGRVKATAAFFGNLFGVKPIILGDAHGNNYAYKKVKGRKTALDTVIEECVSRIRNNTEALVFVEHSDCFTDALYVKEQIIAKANPKEVVITDLGPIIGATVGPDSITVNFYGEKVTIFGEE